MRAVHLWAGAWNYNFWSSFSEEKIQADLLRIKSLGFNAIIAVIPWGEFQKEISQRDLDEKRVGQLIRLADLAAAEGMNIILRVGSSEKLPKGVKADPFFLGWYLWEENNRQQYIDFATRLVGRIDHLPNLAFVFFTWEDMHAIFYEPWLHISKNENPGIFAAFRKYSGQDIEKIEYGSEDYGKFISFTDSWIVQTLLPEFSMAWKKLRTPYALQVRVDGEKMQKSGEPAWTNHEMVWRATGKLPLLIGYFNPSYQAPNRHDIISPSAAVNNFSRLSEVLARNNQNIFYDQFNFVDSTPLFSHNSKFKDEAAIAEFIRGVAPIFKKFPMGYALWSLDQTALNLIYNPSFADGLERWDSVGAILKIAENNSYLELPKMAQIKQKIYSDFNPGKYTKKPYQLEFRIKTESEPARLFVGLYCFEKKYSHFEKVLTIAPKRGWQKISLPTLFAANCDLTILNAGVTEIGVDDFSWHNFVQSLGLYDRDGKAIGKRADAIKYLNTKIKERQ